jgi:hypothetical protein
VVKFYNNRELSDKFGVNLARWKRWAREFLPPDPLAGQQAGYARQYYVDDVFTVFVGGHLVAELGFSIPEARTILTETREWMKARGFRFDPRGNRRPRKDVDVHVKSYALFLKLSADNRLIIFARGTIGRIDYEYEGFSVTKEIYVDQPIVKENGDEAGREEPGANKILLISQLLDQFKKTLDPDGDFFPGLLKP